jgi:hypothetical protein
MSAVGGDRICKYQEGKYAFIEMVKYIFSKCIE